MATPILGAIGLAGVDQDRRPKAWMGLARLTEAREAALAVLTSLMRTETSTSTEINWYERDIEAFEVLSDGAASDAATSLTFKDAAGKGVNFNFRNGTLLKNDRSSEIALITVDPAANTGAVTVTRNFGTNGAKEIINEDRWTLLGVADEDNKASPSALSLEPDRKTNYIQLMREPIEVGAMESQEEFRTGSEYARLRQDAFLAFLRRWERQWIHGQPKKGTGSKASVERNQTGGLLYPISTNTKDFGGNVSETSFQREMGKAFRFGSRVKVGVCGMESSVTIGQMAMFSSGTIYHHSPDDTAGLAITEYQQAVGRIQLLYSPQLGISTNWSNIMILIDTLQLSRVVFPGFELKLLKDVQERGVLGIKDEFIMAAALKLGLQSHHGYWSGMTRIQT